MKVIEEIRFCSQKENETMLITHTFPDGSEFKRVKRFFGLTKRTKSMEKSAAAYFELQKSIKDWCYSQEPENWRDLYMSIKGTVSVDRVVVN